MFARNGGGFNNDLSNTSFDEQSAVQVSQLCDEVIKYRQKVHDTLMHADSIDAKELKTCDDLTPYRAWFIKLIKQSNKL